MFQMRECRLGGKSKRHNWGSVVFIEKRGGVSVSLKVFVAKVVGSRSHSNEDALIVFEFHSR
jgi:hypothetical protein